MKIRNLIANYLEQARILQIGTSIDNLSWICTVYFAYDKDLNIYWISKPTTRHSEEIRKNSKIAGAIVLPQSLGDKVRGLQLEGDAYELSNLKDTAKGLFYLTKKIGLKPTRVKEILDKKDGHLCYKIVPSLFVLFDQLNFPNDPRQEYKM